MARKGDIDVAAVSEEIEQSIADEPPMTPDERATLRETNPHLYDLYRIRDSLRSQIMRLEKEFKESNTPSRLVYPLATLYSKYLETMAEIRSMEEQNQYAAILTSQVLEPMVSGIFQTFTDMLYMLNKVITEETGGNTRIKQNFDKLAMEFGRYLDGSKNEAAAKIAETYGAE